MKKAIATFTWVHKEWPAKSNKGPRLTTETREVEIPNISTLEEYEKVVEDLVENFAKNEKFSFNTEQISVTLFVLAQ